MSDPISVTISDDEDDIDIPNEPDTEITSSNKFAVLKELNECHTNEYKVDTLFVDRVLHKARHSELVKVYNSYSPIPCKDAPYFGKHVKRHRSDQTSPTAIVIPLCDVRFATLPFVYGFTVNEGDYLHRLYSL